MQRFAADRLWRVLYYEAVLTTRILERGFFDTNRIVFLGSLSAKFVRFVRFVVKNSANANALLTHTLHSKVRCISHLGYEVRTILIYLDGR